MARHQSPHGRRHVHAASLQALLDDGRADGFPPELRDGQNLVEALEVHGRYPVTCVLHGDTHTGNLYLDHDGRACFFDWEVVQTGTGRRMSRIISPPY